VPINPSSPPLLLATIDMRLLGACLGGGGKRGFAVLGARGHTIRKILAAFGLGLPFVITTPCTLRAGPNLWHPALVAAQRAGQRAVSKVQDWIKGKGGAILCTFEHGAVISL
jgi:hypothetical protein